MQYGPHCRRGSSDVPRNGDGCDALRGVFAELALELWVSHPASNE